MTASAYYQIQVNFVAFWKVQIVEASKQISRQTNKGTLSLKQVLDSILNDDPENDVSEESSEE